MEVQRHAGRARRTPRRALVTGGAGFVGSHLCEYLLAEGVEVVCVDDLSTGAVENTAAMAADPRFTLVRADVSEGLPVTGPFDLVAHLASPASPLDYLRLPVETLRVGSAGTLHALELARAHGARFLLASTSEVYGDPQVHPQPEDYWGHVNPVGPRSVYDEAKRFAEAATTAYRTRHGVDTGIVRIFNTYGPRMRAHDGRVIPTFVSQALVGEPLTVAGDGSQTRSFCHVDDTVAGLWAMARCAHPGPINIGGANEMTVAELADRVIRLTGSRSRIRHVPLPQDDPRVRRPDTTLAREVLGWRPSVEVDAGLATVVEWFARRAQAVA
ncbi:UDP-glucuronic acid decarboxylase family protein [Allostreptomyces psammosilenae]|uniref:dTDP-glucose 4,6-dehydratase n=1 Tax=Allostreptomyces psammosilenae TaxID=1892865 RepID=A0A853A0R9_9ACTN|nr:UDP-glucuronic acid decarboxylase family protein [Allostreptomyces psammosilenae]NYI04102.1 dTDP-glucose 4,6-dehydratase [Allostreptomyces psammosilenae]